MTQATASKIFSKLVGLVLAIIVGLFLLGLFWFDSDVNAKCQTMADPVRAQVGDVVFSIPASLMPSFENAPEKSKAPQSSYFASNREQTFGYCQSENDKPFIVDTIYLVDGNTFQETLNKKFKGKFKYIGKRVDVSFMRNLTGSIPKGLDKVAVSSKGQSQEALRFGNIANIYCTEMGNIKSGNLCRIIQPINNSVKVDASYWSKKIPESELANVFSEIEEFYRELTKK